MSESPFFTDSRPSTERYDTHIANTWVSRNHYLAALPEEVDLPTYPQVRDRLPEPFWSGHAANINCYWRAWELAFSNLKKPSAANGFVSNYCDTAFNGNLFMWDSCFITCFGSYGRRAFNFQKTLDNFYRKQHRDGFISREISESDGEDTFHRFDPSSTGPNVMAWAEWDHYLKTGDKGRLAIVYPPLVAYHQWMRNYRTWKDGTYWLTGWGTGMDNLHRFLGTEHLAWSNGRMTWVEATFQAILSARRLLQMADILGEGDALPDMRAEIDRLADYVNRYLWDEKKSYYFDQYDNDALSSVKHIGTYWALLAGCVPADRLPGLIDHLENPAEFNRTHRIPALSADDPHFSGAGDYWSGGVWAPTNYMVLKGLDATNHKELAHRIARNHNQNVVDVFEQENTPWTGAEQFRQYFHLPDLKVDDRHTLWETYAPDSTARGDHSRPGYVGWTGLPPVAVLFEDIFGLVSDAPAQRLTWDIRLLEEHGINRYPFGQSGTLDLKCAARASQLDRPSITVHSNLPLTLEVIWGGGRETVQINNEN